MKVSLKTRTPVVLLISTLLLVGLFCFAGCNQEEADGINSPTAPDFLIEPVEPNNTFVDAQQLTITDAIEIHNQITDYCINQFNSYNELITALDDGWLLPEIYDRFLVGTPFDKGKENLPNPGDILLPREEKVFTQMIQNDLYNRFENRTQYHMDHGNLSQEVGNGLLAVGQNINSPNGQVDISQDLHFLGQTADSNGQKFEITVIGISIGSLEYGTGQWDGYGDGPPEIDDWAWTLLADTVGGLAGLPGAGTAIITAGLFSAAAIDIQNHLE